MKQQEIKNNNFTEETLIEILKQKHKQSNGSCGTYIIDIINKYNIKLIFLQSLISSLISKRVIVKKQGIHGELLMLNNK